ncbi:transposase [Paenibacillus swuensis]|uniref:Transposase n=1 Tax=Paenibacillus swuensis TaxID=1178515 RepID=A0A172TF07_9BACL|nr:IS110 family transposase [Paenibacillus swuensis]ANE45484.1 transposase [Paenibacillus swuensis]ANE45768.1 transposase [Paenibacillus swuensis]ANE46057.1 transposase [Paenibacillus swuensis]ANE46511.1 transposase [Paenibacillus swuensis]
MNFTKKDQTNQRIERITMKHAVVGIDIAKDAHAAQITDYRGRALTPRHLAFTNTQEGYERLLRWVKDVQAKKGLSYVVVGLEPTGHYWFNLAHWLREQGVKVVLVNPVTTHRNKENRDNSPSKNDPKDALVIADVVSRGYYTEYNPQADTFEQMKAMVSQREFWVKQSVTYKNRITRWIDLYFPEFSQVFPDWTRLRSLATLRIYPLPSDLVNISADQILDTWREQGMKRVGGVSGVAKATELLSVAQRSIGKANVPEEARLEIKCLLKAYDEAVAALDAIELHMETLLESLPLTEQLQSIHGLGSMTIATIIGCAGDLRLYAHGQQLLRRAGLNLAESTSGRHKGQIKLSKRGDATLRKHFFLAVLCLIRQHPDFKRFHEHNVKVKGMKKMVSVFKLIGKLARMIVGMIQRGESYRSDLHFQAVA